MKLKWNQKFVLALSLTIIFLLLWVIVIMFHPVPHPVPHSLRFQTKTNKPFTKQIIIDQVKLDLASKLMLNVEDIGVVSMQPKMWTDQSLGCPEPNQGYAQVITNGYRIEVKAIGDPRSFYYHATANDVVLCSQNEKTVAPLELHFIQ